MAVNHGVRGSSPLRDVYNIFRYYISERNLNKIKQCLKRFDRTISRRTNLNINTERDCELAMFISLPTTIYATELANFPLRDVSQYFFKYFPHYLVMDLDKAIQNRHSVRKFSDKKPSWKKIIECIDSVRYAPMTGNNFTLKLILVDDQEKINKISEACQQHFVGQAQYVVIVCSDPSRPKNVYEKAGDVFVKIGRASCRERV